MRKILTRSILLYLRILAKIQLKKIHPEIIGITGSAGKTSTSYAIKTILATKYKTKLSQNANSETGIPLNILGLQPTDYSFFDWLRLLSLSPIMILLNWGKYEKYIVEMGIDSPYEPKNMQYLLKIVKPTVGVFLNALPVHTQFFDELETDTDPKIRENSLRKIIAQEKGKLIESLPKNGWAILNIDDPFVRNFVSKTEAHYLTIGRNSKDFIIKDVQKTLLGFRCDLRYMTKDYCLTIKNQILSDDYAYSFLAALAVGICNGISVAEGIKALENNFQLPPGRMSLIPGLKKTILIDSSYNASKFTLLEALMTLKGFSGKKRIAVLGDMRELGKEEKIAHEEVAKTAIDCTDIIITVGPLMEKYFLPKVKRTNFPANKIYSFKSSKGVGEWMKKNIIQGEEVILIKGSQNNIFLERVVEDLMENPSEADKLLCRRGKFWEQKRQAV